MIFMQWHYNPFYTEKNSRTLYIGRVQLQLSGYMWLDTPKEKWLHYFANSGDIDQTWHSMASELGLHGLSVTLLGAG